MCNLPRRLASHETWEIRWRLLRRWGAEIFKVYFLVSRAPPLHTNVTISVSTVFIAQGSMFREMWLNDDSVLQTWWLSSHSESLSPSRASNIIKQLHNMWCAVPHVIFQTRLAPVPKRTVQWLTLDPDSLITQKVGYVSRPPGQIQPFYHNLSQSHRAIFLSNAAVCSRVPLGRQPSATEDHFTVMSCSSGGRSELLEQHWWLLRNKVAT